MNILIIDDEKNIRYTLSEILTDEGHQVIGVESGEKGLSILKKQSFEFVILDVKLPGIDGIEVFKEIQNSKIETDVLIISGHSDIETAVEVVKLGAYDFLEKPLSIAKILTSVRNVSEKHLLQSRSKQLDEDIRDKYRMVGKSAQIQFIRKTIEKVAPTNTKILIRGESGTGKELVAWAIHQNSNRFDKPFIAFNSAALPSELVESELFGYEKGAFTGANQHKPGKLEMANGGTLFLDEIGDMSLGTQAKVLRVIQEGKFERVGGQQTIEIDVRIIAATHKILENMIKEKTFREDLYFRLNVLPIILPPLRERIGDIKLLTDYFLQYFSVELKISPKTITKSALNLLNQFSFPGNIRELKNLIERLCILVQDDKITTDHIKPHLNILNQSDEDCIFKIDNFSKAKQEFEIRFLTEYLDNYDWNISKVAEILGIHQSNLSRKLKELGLRKSSNH